ncbi:MAG: hypothetical protein PHI98_16355 [Eubacteriales bacterium]|nr:hypothetical protein [Eubacteriales bacterium]
MKQTFKRIFAFVVALTACLGMMGGAMAQAQDGADLEALYPLMDLVCAAAMEAQSDEEYAIVIPDSEGELSPKFVDAFIRLGQTRGAALGVTAEMMNDTAAQQTLMSSIFAAQLPELSTVVPTESEAQYIGFRAGTVNDTGENQTLQVVGEIYLASKPMQEMSTEEFMDITWLDRGIFTFKSDATALNGFRLMGFSSGTDLNMETAFMEYSADIVVEYVNSQLGFTISYPAFFDDELLYEDATGVSAELADKSASFFARRIENTDQSELQSYVDVIASGIQGAKASIVEGLNCGTVSYTTDDGYIVFDVYIVAEKYIYQAELRYKTELASSYSMYNAYMENSFVVDEVAAG